MYFNIIHYKHLWLRLGLGSTDPGSPLFPGAPPSTSSCVEGHGRAAASTAVGDSRQSSGTESLCVMKNHLTCHTKNVSSPSSLSPSVQRCAVPHLHAGMCCSSAWNTLILYLANTYHLQILLKQQHLVRPLSSWHTRHPHTHKAYYTDFIFHIYLASAPPVRLTTLYCYAL